MKDTFIHEDCKWMIIKSDISNKTTQPPKQHHDKTLNNKNLSNNKEIHKDKCDVIYEKEDLTAEQIS